ncbi:uncharacterized protein MONOS_6099 [Monocercomonoides exilis]|uniref:uncharacterized protein n=1 Tax=Monocercomonoides exilis TaxID=2049356 RepID=UPI00355A5F5F|nr:hypothetical protein MONOS_6099 [Monocercomonoides exilis]
MTVIMKYHQEHLNLTRLTYQSSWKFLVARLEYDKSLGDAIINALHFTREAARELEELSKYVDWKREKEEEKVLALMEWLNTIEFVLTIVDRRLKNVLNL